MISALVRRTNAIEYQRLYFPHQNYPVRFDSTSFRTNSNLTNLRQFCLHRIISNIFFALRLMIIIPFKCLATCLQFFSPGKSNQFYSLPYVKRVQVEQYCCEYGSVKYFALCGLSGMISCGITHTLLVPLDLIKCRLQVKPQKYLNFLNGFHITITEEGFFGLTKGWAATLIGYSFQGLGKFGFYEIFKIFYTAMLGEENAFQYRTFLYLLSSASAELFADVALAPWEATKVRIQTQDNWASTLRRGLPKLYAEEGLWGFYKGLVPLWLRQIPYTMMKFACFERTVEAIYKYIVPKPRDQCTKSEQLSVTFIAGYIAGIFCAIVSHPADTIVSKLNNEKGLHLFDAVRRIGFAGMWKGLGTRIFMIGTLTALQWFIYDTMKVLLQIPRPPSVHSSNLSPTKNVESSR